MSRAAARIGVAAVIAILAGCAAPVVTRRGPDFDDVNPTGPEVISAMERAYKKMTRYGDIGVETVGFKNPKGETSWDQSFETTFVRPRLRFEVTGQNPPLHRIVWFDRTTAFAESSKAPDKVAKTTLDAGLLEADLASDGRPPLVLGYLIGRPAALHAPSVVGSGRFADRECWIVESIDGNNGYRLMIDKQQFVLREMVHVTHLAEGLEMSEVLRFETAIDDPTVVVDDFDVADRQIVDKLPQ